jgi:triacylglycerol lipase
MRQRHSARHLFWRAVVAATGNAAMATGLYPLLPHAGMVWERRRAGRSAPPRQARAAATEWALAVAMSAARPLGFLGLPVSLARRRGLRPVVLLHGHAMNRANFLPLGRRLARAGLGPLSGFEYWSLGSVRAAARRLGEHVEEICHRTGAPRVDLVGHSMGGLVARYYVTLGGGSPRVRNLVTLGSPHGGADLSVFGFGRPARELKPGSDLLHRLAAQPLPAETAITVIWSRSDALVPWDRQARLPGCDEVAFDDLGHLTLLASRRVAEVVIERLRR